MRVLMLSGLVLSSTAWAGSLTVTPVGDLYLGQPVGFTVSGAIPGDTVVVQMRTLGTPPQLFGRGPADASGQVRVAGFLPGAVGEGDSVQVTARALPSGDESPMDLRWVVSTLPDVDAAYDDGYAAGEASVVIPDGDYYCDAASTDWDEVAGACVSSVEEMSCLQSGYCQGADDYWGTGLPNSKVGNATVDECQAVYDSDDYWAWHWGVELAPHSLTGMNAYLCE